MLEKAYEEYRNLRKQGLWKDKNQTPGAEDGKENLEVLRFDILKDVYLEKKHQKDQAAEDVQKKIELEKLDEIIAKKQNAELENMSVEELMKKREELLKK